MVQQMGPLFNMKRLLLDILAGWHVSMTSKVCACPTTLLDTRLNKGSWPNDEICADHNLP